MSWLAPITVGIAFGVALERAELTRKERVVGVFSFTDFTMLKFLLTALTTGAFVVQAALSLDLVRTIPLPPTVPVANLVGGALFGAAMATAGFCSGTIFAAAGSGRPGLVAGMGGLLAGGLLMEGPGRALATLVRTMGGRLEGSLPQISGVNAWLLLLALLLATLFMGYLLERGAPAKPHHVRDRRVTNASLARKEVVPSNR